MEKLDLIILPFHDYKKWLNEGFRTRDAHLFQHFKNNKNVNKILVINRPVSLVEMIVKRIKWKTETKNKEIYSEKNWRIVETESNSYYLDILSMDIFKVILEKKKWWNTIFNSNEIISIINKACDILELENRCILLQNPMAIGVVGKLNEKKFAFDAIDNWLYHPQNKKYYDLIQKNYNIIDEKADVIFTVSESLKGVFKLQNNIHCIPNAVDKDYFKECIRSYCNNKTMTIGYVGKIQDRVDFDLIEKCLIEFNDCKFLFLGPVLSCHEKVKYLSTKYKNIEFVGDIHYDILPRKMKEIDIAIIPHLVNNFTESMSPLKLYEYLSAGKQVITTKIAGVNEFSKYVYISENKEEFIINIKKAINLYKEEEDIDKKIVDLIKYHYTWESKCDLMIKELG